jgi:hypothetical protein
MKGDIQTYVFVIILIIISAVVIIYVSYYFLTSKSTVVEGIAGRADVSMPRTYLEYSDFIWPEKENSILDESNDDFCKKLEECVKYYLLNHEPCLIGIYDEFGDPEATKINPIYRQNEGKFTKIQNNLTNKIKSKSCSFGMNFPVGPNVEQVIGQSNIVGPFLNPLADIYGLYFYDMKLRNASVYNNTSLSDEQKPYYLYEGYDFSRSSVLCTPKGYTLRIDDTRYFSPGKYKVDLLNVSVDTSGGLPKYNVAVGFGFLPYLSNTTTNSTPLKIIDTIRSLDFNPLMPQWNIECLTDKPFVENAVCVESRDKVPSGAEYCGDCSYTAADGATEYNFYSCYPNECNNAVKSCSKNNPSICVCGSFAPYNCTRYPLRFRKYVIPINESGGVDVAQVINAIKWGFYSSKRFEFANTYWDVKKVSFGDDPWNDGSDSLTDAIDPKNADPNDRTHIIRKIYFDCGADYICQKQITMYIGYLRLGNNGLCYNNPQSCKYIVFAVGFKGD